MMGQTDMRCLRYFVIGIGLMLAGTGCSAFQRVGNDAQKGPKTLVSWELGKVKNEELNVENKAEESDELKTDRPDFTEASSTVGKGRIQLEAGYTFSRNREASITGAHSFPESLLRIGMFADWFEIRIGQNVNNVRQFDEEGPISANGADDLYMGVKLALTEQRNWMPESAIIIQTTLATGSRNKTANQTLPGLSYLYSWEMTEILSLAGSSQGNAARDESGQTYLELAQSLSLNYKLTSKFGAYTEWFAFFPSGAVSPGTSAIHYFDGGFTYKLTPNFQYDIRAGVGLSRNADDFFVGTGFAVRY